MPPLEIFGRKCPPGGVDFAIDWSIPHQKREEFLKGFVNIFQQGFCQIPMKYPPPDNIVRNGDARSTFLKKSLHIIHNPSYTAFK